MYLVLSDSVLKKAWGSSAEYWFSRVDYSIHNADELSCNDNTKLFESGFIPFVTISNEEVIRAYINSLNNRKISSAFEGLSSQEYVETFWKYYNAYEDISTGFADFEKSFLLKKVTEWCDEYSIEYVVENE
ncbi:MAG: hypothetical protein LIO62_02640 [Clostridiales bacterium]|nr:hypothetical protein [Clostridiales bacterium]